MANKIPDDPNVAKLMGNTVMTMGMDATKDTTPPTEEEAGFQGNVPVEKRPTVTDHEIDKDAVAEKLKTLKVEDPDPKDAPQDTAVFARDTEPVSTVKVPVERRDSAGNILKAKGKLVIQNY